LVWIAGIRVVTGPLEQTALAPEVSTAVFRIVQEALTNIEHSGATFVEIRLGMELAGLVLQIRDNGRGTPEDETTGYGSVRLLGIQERAHSFGGRLSIQGIRGEGTTLRTEIPISAV
jgi:signal transduction histidine kinase